tara:strand:+ start:10297 stop:10425 length:129 start_codon:yes stop_codon:yes gene_type:complete
MKLKFHQPILNNKELDKKEKRANLFSSSSRDTNNKEIDIEKN